MVSNSICIEWYVPRMSHIRIAAATAESELITKVELVDEEEFAEAVVEEEEEEEETGGSATAWTIALASKDSKADTVVHKGTMIVISGSLPGVIKGNIILAPAKVMKKQEAMYRIIARLLARNLDFSSIFFCSAEKYRLIDLP